MLKGGWYTYPLGDSYHDPIGKAHFFEEDKDGVPIENSPTKWGEVPLCGDHRISPRLRSSQMNRPLWVEQLCRKCRAIKAKKERE